ncbi:MAG: L,D-transpeptidase [Gemmatimonadaceae bacterium]
MRAVIKSAAILGIFSTAAFVAPKAAPLSAKADGAPSIGANITDKQLLLKLGDSVVQTYDFASGQDKYPTPTGSFTIRKLTWNPPL